MTALEAIGGFLARLSIEIEGISVRLQATVRWVEATFKAIALYIYSAEAAKAGDKLEPSNESDPGLS